VQYGLGASIIVSLP